MARRGRHNTIITGSLLLAACPDGTVITAGSTANDEVAADTADASTTAPNETGTDTDDIVEDHRTYFIGETTKFEGGGTCNGTNLNTATSTLRNRLDDFGWSGHRFVNENSWPEDFQESTIWSEGLDGVYGDTTRLAVYAGHGFPDLLQWGTSSDNDICLNRLSLFTRLGTLSGDTAAAAMLLSSCTMRFDQAWPILRKNATRQFLGYHDSPYIGYDEARKVFERTQDGQPTVDAWLAEMEQNGVPGKFSPIALTMGITAAEAASIHGTTNLATGEGFIKNVAEPAEGFYFEVYNNGCTTACGNCPNGSVVPPTITLGTIVPQVSLARTTPSSAQLVDLVITLMPVLGLPEPNASARARLETWAGSIMDEGDLSYTQFLDDPRIDVVYDPQFSQLEIANRSALDRARPRPGEPLEEGVSDAAVVVEATAARDELQQVPAMLDGLGPQFEASTREVRMGEGLEQAPQIVYETLFSLPGEHAGLTLVGRSLGVGVTRLGERSRITVSLLEAEPIGEARFVRTPQHAIDQLVAAVHSEHPDAIDVEIVSAEVGYALTEDQVTAQVVPSLIVSYVVIFGADEASRVVSRRVAVKISLVTVDSPIESLMAADPNPEPGDTRDPH